MQPLGKLGQVQQDTNTFMKGSPIARPDIAHQTPLPQTVLGWAKPLILRAVSGALPTPYPISPDMCSGRRAKTPMVVYPAVEIPFNHLKENGCLLVPPYHNFLCANLPPQPLGISCPSPHLPSPFPPSPCLEIMHVTEFSDGFIDWQAHFMTAILWCSLLQWG